MYLDRMRWIIVSSNIAMNIILNPSITNVSANPDCAFAIFTINILDINSSK